MILQILFSFVLNSYVDSNEVNLHLSNKVKTEHMIPYSPEDEDDDYYMGLLRLGLIFYDKRIEPELNIMGIGTQYSEEGIVPDDSQFVTFSHKHRLKKIKR